MKRVITALVCLIFMVSIIPVDAASVCGDTDGDGIVTIMDATYIQRFLASMETDAPVGEREIKDYEPIEYNFEITLGYEELDIDDTFHIYNPDELTPEIWGNRAGTNDLVIERLICEVGDDSRGRVINTTSDEERYVSYKYSDLRLVKGTIVITYRLFDPNNNLPDKIYNRYDYLLDRSFEIHN